MVGSGPGIVYVRFTAGVDNGLSTVQQLGLKTGDHPRKGRQILEFSRRSRATMLKAALFYPWHELGRLGLVTLTYPEKFPMNGREVKDHLRRLMRRWAQRWGQRPRGIWCLEFQQRGAPHFHAFVELPRRAFEIDFDGCTVIEQWGLSEWGRIVGFSTDRVTEQDHRNMRLRFNVSPAWYAAGKSAVRVAEYMADHSGKWIQKQPPPGYKNVGRFWGVLGRSSPPVETEFCCERSYFVVRRVLRKLAWKHRGTVTFRRPTNGRRVTRPAVTRAFKGSVGGTWSAAHDGVGLEPVLVAWASSVCGCGRAQSSTVAALS